MDEQKKYEVIKKLVDANGNKNRAAKELDISRRQINRLIKAYRENGRFRPSSEIHECKNLCWHSFYLDSGLIIRKNISYRLSRLPKAPEGQGLDSLYLIFKT